MSEYHLKSVIYKQLCMEVKVELSASKQKSVIDKVMADKIITNVSFYVMNINIFYFHTYVYRVIIQLVEGYMSTIYHDICIRRN